MIGEFSRMTHLSVKALRHYHDVGVLEPATIDPSTGYRSYEARQVAMAQVIRRLRDLGMPLDSIRTVLAAPDIQTRNREIAAHLARMEDQLAQTPLGTAVAERAIGIDGPIREYYLVGFADTDDETQHRTEICWPGSSTSRVTEVRASAGLPGALIRGGGRHAPFGPKESVAAGTGPASALRAGLGA